MLSDAALWDLAGIAAQLAKSTGLGGGPLGEVALYAQFKANKADVEKTCVAFHTLLHHHGIPAAEAEPHEKGQEDVHAAEETV